MKELLFFAAGFACLAATGAEAQNRNCANREKVVARLADGYGESRQAIGLGANNQVVETFANLESGTWTVTVTMPNGITCLVASGKAFELVEEALIPTGEKDA
ncbi:hypothetical protein KUV47_01170 [Vannielia litorea]|uniref:hypothetical protein n=1 Tax=Vannielia TaxID=2813041 RepID=UPI001C9414D7|nr:hypothetical protein [Vannielia litorea]MBY6048293.1 hypothetical protein [Vannielia litorea]MBY6075707.1 hypothetical protein [Vannielia litorea]MBY6151807.1 hypothetical protein [Vannielia litorea]